MTELTLYRPVRIVLRAAGAADCRASAEMGTRNKWRPMAAILDWSIVKDCEDFFVCIRYAAMEELRKQSDNPTYNGRRDFKRIPGGREFTRSICEVRRKRDEHQAYVKSGEYMVRTECGDRVAERIIREEQVMATVRIFISAQYLRHGLDVMSDAFRTVRPTHIGIRPIPGGIPS